MESIPLISWPRRRHPFLLMAWEIGKRIMDTKQIDSTKQITDFLFGCDRGSVVAVRYYNGGETDMKAYTSIHEAMKDNPVYHPLISVQYLVRL